jgi:hypothetical protein
MGIPVSRWFRMRETVVIETPAFSAISFKVMAEGVAFMISLS